MNSLNKEIFQLSKKISKEYKQSKQEYIKKETQSPEITKENSKKKNNKKDLEDKGDYQYQLSSKMQTELTEKFDYLKITFESILYLLFLNSNNRVISSALELYLMVTRHIKLVVNGVDLISAGYPKGPLIGKILKTALSAKISGLIISASSKSDQKGAELEWIKKNFSLEEQNN